MDHFHTKTHKLKGSISPNIQENIKYTKKVMQNCNDLSTKQFKIRINHEILIYIVYMDGLSKCRNASRIRHKAITSRLFSTRRTAIDQYVIESADWKWINTMEDAMTAILSGNTVYFWMEKQGYLISSKSFPTEVLQNADQEVAIVGPKDSFTGV